MSIERLSEFIFFDGIFLIASLERRALQCLSKLTRCLERVLCWCSSIQSLVVGKGAVFFENSSPYSILDR